MADAIRADDLAACRALLQGGSKSFFAAGQLLPGRVMKPATALYAFCRLADDAVDLGGASLQALKRKVDAIYDGRPEDGPTDRALAAVVEAHRLPRELLDALLEGFAWDAAGRQYNSLDELLAYAARVAGTVGAMMAVLMGVREARVVARACELGVAMQLSNIARDVGEDARAGRLYLPLEWMRAEGLDAAAFLQAPRFSPALGRVVRQLVLSAEPLYARADAGIAALPVTCRLGIAAARQLYAAIGHRVLRAGGNSVDGRAQVPGWRKAALLGAAIPAIASRRDGGMQALPAVRHLVGAVASGQADVPAPGRLLWVLELFAQLDSRQALASVSRSDP